MIGYTLHIVKKNKSADGRKVGVQIGRTCINKNIPVREIATVANVSTVTVYNWFIGEYSPRKEIADKILAYIAAR